MHIVLTLEKICWTQVHSWLLVTIKDRLTCVIFSVLKPTLSLHAPFCLELRLVRTQHAVSLYFLKGKTIHDEIDASVCIAFPCMNTTILYKRLHIFSFEESFTHAYEVMKSISWERELPYDNLNPFLIKWSQGSNVKTIPSSSR